MRLFHKHLNFKAEVRSISNAASSSPAAKYTEEGFLSHQPFVEAQTYVTSTEWKEVKPAWENAAEQLEEPLQAVPETVPQQLVKKHRGTTNMHFIGED